MIEMCCSGGLPEQHIFLFNAKKQSYIYNNVKKTKYVFYHNKYY
jgi:hypothetical protein